jgi:hypothetical protein
VSYGLSNAAHNQESYLNHFTTNNTNQPGKIDKQQETEVMHVKKGRHCRDTQCTTNFNQTQPTPPI